MSKHTYRSTAAKVCAGTKETLPDVVRFETLLVVKNCYVNEKGEIYLDWIFSVAI